MSKVWPVPLTAALLAAVLLIGGCEPGRPGRPGSPGGATGGAPAAQEPAVSPGTPPAQGERPRQSITLEKVDPAAADRPPVRAVSEQTPLLSLDRDGRLMPEDFRIGALQDTLQGGRELAIDRVVERFLGELAKARIDSGSLDPSLRDELVRSLTWYVSGGFVPDRFRIGRISREEGAEACAHVRLFRGENSAEGDVYLSASDGTWYITDVQVGLDMLGETPEPSGDRFVPPEPGSRLAP